MKAFMFHLRILIWLLQKHTLMALENVVDLTMSPQQATANIYMIFLFNMKSRKKKLCD